MTIYRTFATGLHLLLLPTLLCLDAAEAEASFRQRGPDARIEAMGGAGVALETSAFGICYNPASGGADGGSAAISYSIPFGDTSLKTLHAAIAENDLPIDRKGGVSLSYRRYGSDAYRETSVHAGYSTTITGRLRAGIAAGILERDSEHGSSSSAPGLDIGLLAGISDSFSLGASARNLNRPKIGDSGETVPAAVVAGAAYRPADEVLLTVAVENRERSDTRGPRAVVSPVTGGLQHASADRHRRSRLHLPDSGRGYRHRAAFRPGNGRVVYRKNPVLNKHVSPRGARPRTRPAPCGSCP